MELYILDSMLRRAVVLDRFESMIWTERYSAWGDFELLLFSTPEMRRLLPTGTRLAMSDSYRIMEVEFVENTHDSDGRLMLKASGRSLEKILEDRTARSATNGLGQTPYWTLTGTPGGIARQIFDRVCRSNPTFPNDQIPFITAGSLFPAGNIKEPEDIITIELELQDVYTAIKEICDVYDLGFRLVRNFDKSQLFFDIYTGNDRTTGQTVISPVVFAPNLDNLTDISEITSTSTYRNVAYVHHPSAFMVVPAEGISEETISGFERRVLTVDASDITPPEPPYSLSKDETDAVNYYIDLVKTDEEKDRLRKLLNKVRLYPEDDTWIVNYIAATTSGTAAQKAAVTAVRNKSLAYDPIERLWLEGELLRRGKQELSKNGPISAFDGELPINNPYRYERQYQLGDLVEMRNTDGVTNQMRVTEQIFVSDAQGERAYPTLAINRFITPGSWLAWDYNEDWINAQGFWIDA